MKEGGWNTGIERALLEREKRGLWLLVMLMKDLPIGIFGSFHSMCMPNNNIFVTFGQFAWLINEASSTRYEDASLCIMILSLCCYFETEEVTAAMQFFF